MSNSSNQAKLQALKDKYDKVRKSNKRSWYAKGAYGAISLMLYQAIQLDVPIELIEILIQDTHYNAHKGWRDE